MARHTVRNPDFEAVVRASYARQGLMAHLGAELVRVAPGEVEIGVGFRDVLTQQHGFFHAGVTTAIVDSACGYAALTVMAAGSEVLSVDFTTHLLAPARGDRIVARARVIRSGRTITVCQGDVFAIADGARTHCAAMTATMMRVDAPTVDTSTT